MAWNPVFDLEKTLGDLYFIGVDEKFKYEGGEKTDKKIYAYKLASSGQSDPITVKIPKEVKLDRMCLCEVVGVDINQYIQSSGDFQTIMPSIKAEDIKQIGTITVKKSAPQG